MYVVDASVWVCRFVPSDAHHSASREWLERVLRAGTPLMGPVILVAEVAGAVSRRTRPDRGHRAVHEIQRLREVRLLPLTLLLARSAAGVAADLKVKGYDAVYLALAQRLGVPLITWDNDLRTRGSAVHSVQRPSESNTSR